MDFLVRLGFSVLGVDLFYRARNPTPLQLEFFKQGLPWREAETQDTVGDVRHPETDHELSHSSQTGQGRAGCEPGRGSRAGECG
jgi:hypothetical protein